MMATHASGRFELGNDEKRGVHAARDLVYRFELMPADVADDSIAAALALLDDIRHHGHRFEVRDLLVRHDTGASWDRARAVELVDILSSGILGLLM